MSSGYSNDEISKCLSEMGYMADPIILDTLRDELINFDADHDDFNVDDFVVPAREALHDLDLTLNNGQYEHLSEVGKMFDPLINEAKEVADSLFEEICRLEDMLEKPSLDLDGDDVPEEPELPALPIHIPPADSERQRQSVFSSAPRPAAYRPNYKPSKKLPGFEFDVNGDPIPIKRDTERRSDENRDGMLVDRKTERELIDQVCRDRGLKQVRCPAPGRAPYKHDPVLRNAQYRDVWKKFPAPGEDRRLAMRWKIRQIMLQRDIPELKLVPNAQFRARRLNWAE